MAGVRAWRKRKSPLPRGFTLLEILVVLVLAALLSALVLPNLFLSPGAGLRDEARRLHQVLRLAADEAQFTVRPHRWCARRDGYHFERADGDGEWQPLAEPPLDRYALAGEVTVEKLRRPAPGSFMADPPEGGGAPDEDDLGCVVLYPDATRTVSDIVLAAPTDGERATAVIAVRPGPGGIRPEAP